MMETNQEVESGQLLSGRLFLEMLGEDNMPYGYQNDFAVGGTSTTEVPSVQNDDDCCDMVLAMSPGDSSQQQNPNTGQLEMLDLEVIRNMLKEAAEMHLHTEPVEGLDVMYLQQPSQSPLMYEAPNQDFTQLHLMQEEIPQAVPVQNPSAVISGVVPVTNMIFDNFVDSEEIPQAVPVQNPSAVISGVVSVTNMIFDNFVDSEEIPQAVPVQNPSAMISGVVPVTNMIGTINQSQLQDISSEQPMAVDLADPQKENEIEKSSPSARADEVKNEREGPAPKVEEVPTLPDYRELLIRIRYRSQEVVREHVKNLNGCLVYYSKPWQFNVKDPIPAGVEFPDIIDEQRMEMTESQFKFTDHVLKALEKGLLLRCDDYGNIYATRFCRSKIFWCSTEKGPIADAQMSNLTLQKLERNQPVMVFDSSLFQKRLLHYVVNKPTFKSEAGKLPKNRHKIPVSPAVFFTFAQSWNPMNSALSSCLVSMVVNPVRARMQRQWGNEDMHESYDISNYRLQISNESGENPLTRNSQN